MHYWNKNKTFNIENNALLELLLLTGIVVLILIPGMMLASHRSDSSLASGGFVKKNITLTANTDIVLQTYLNTGSVIPLETHYITAIPEK